MHILASAEIPTGATRDREGWEAHTGDKTESKGGDGGGVGGRARSGRVAAYLQLTGSTRANMTSRVHVNYRCYVVSAQLSNCALGGNSPPEGKEKNSNGADELMKLKTEDESATAYLPRHL